MKTISVEIAGEKRILCYSLRVIKAIEARFGSETDMRAQLTSGSTGNVVDITCWLMSQLMIGGKGYADKMHLACPDPLSPEDMLDLYDVGDLLEMQSTIQNALPAGSQQEVEATGKNAEATPGE